MKLKIYIFISYCILSISTNDLGNASHQDQTLELNPAFVVDPYILLMFNGSSDLHNHATFSDYKDKSKQGSKYTGTWSIEITNSTPFTNDYSLVMKGQSVHSAISFGLRKPFTFKSQCLIVQYDTRFPTDHECGGAYIKLLSETVNMNLKEFSDSTPYTIMFGPDKCGMDYEVKFLFQYLDRSTNTYKERKFKESHNAFPRFIGDNVTHVHTLVLCANNSVQIYKDLRLIKEGNLLTDFEPSIGGVEFIVDLEDTKPIDWDDREEIPDPDIEKPKDWNEDLEEFITDIDAKKPKNWLEKEPFMIKSNEQRPYNWNEEKDGKWNPPMVRNYKCKVNGCGPWFAPKIRNPLYRGKWNPPMIENPNYKGEWKPQMIPNPNYKIETAAYRKLRPFGSLGIEIMSQKSGISFDNFLITDNFTTAREFAMYTWLPKYKVDTVDMPHYQDLFSKKKKVHKTKLSEYIHWFWASVPLVVGIPFLSYLAILIVKKSNRDPEIMKEKCILRAYELLKKNDERYSSVDMIPDSDFLTKEMISEVSDNSIDQVFLEPNEKIAAIIRKRISRKAKIEMQLPAGDIL